MSDVIRISRKIVGEMMKKLSIVHDQENNNESILSSSLSSITPCSKVCELAVLSGNDDGNESWFIAKEEVDDDALANECARFVEGGSDDDNDDDIYVRE